jgi:hypothetical protein
MVCFLLLMSGCARARTTSGSEQAASTDLRITVWPGGAGGVRKEWTLRCEPPGGSLPAAAQACRALTPEALRPIPPDTICTQIYGGPQTAQVRGRLEGRPVDARFGRSNGCEIHSWNRVRFLFPVKI